jgi:ribonuclease HI
LDTQHTIFKAELIGIILGLTLLESEPDIDKAKVMIGVDNQVAIQSIGNLASKLGHQHAEAIFGMINKLKSRYAWRGFELTMQWVAGHEDIEGNEMADILAKQAAKGHSSHTNLLPKMLTKGPLPASIAALQAAHKKELKNRWLSDWQTSPRYGKLAKTDPSLPSTRFMKLTQTHPQIPKYHSSLLFQLRISHIPLNKYLHCFKLTDSPKCPACGLHNKTVIRRKKNAACGGPVGLPGRFPMPETATEGVLRFLRARRIRASGNCWLQGCMIT